MGETAPRYETRDTGFEVAVPVPVMAHRRSTDTRRRLEEADAALDAASGAILRAKRSTRAAHITVGANDMAAILGHVRAAEGLLRTVETAVREASGEKPAVAA